VQFISEEKVDIVCFQEFFYLENMSPSLSDIRDGLKTTKHYYIDHFEHTNNIYYGIATFSKYPIIGKGNIRFKNSLNSAIYTDILIKGDTIRVYNNHLQSYKIHHDDIEFIDNFKFEYNEDQVRHAKSLSAKMYRAYVKRAEQAEIVSDHIKNSPYPVIVCGDFNDTPVSFAYNKVKGKLKDSFVESGYGVSNTYNGNIPSFRIDYIFHDSFFSSQNYERKDVAFSDHYPVMCELKIEQ
jgi:endonuclease/exonuclease/phosphatase family metal-dependent hydrolase